MVKFILYLVILMSAFTCSNVADAVNPYYELITSVQKQETERDINCLAQNIYFEARGESLVGQVAVAEVTLNRVKSPKFPNTVCSVVFQEKHGICQFSWCRNKIKIKDEKSWKESYKVARGVLTGKLHLSILSHALYYHAFYVRPRWSYSKIRIARIGNHIFYRNKKELI